MIEQPEIDRTGSWAKFSGVKTLTVAEVARNLNRCVERVFKEHESFELVKHGVPYAHLVPPNGRHCDSHELADDMSAAPLSAEERRVFASTVRQGRKHLKPLRNPWG